MQDSQNLTSSPTTGSQLSGTRDPQTVSNTAQASTSNSLQDTTASLNDSASVRISSVGSTTFTPIDTSSTSVSTATTAQPVNHHYPVVIGGAVIIVVMLIVTWLMSRNHKI